MPEVDCGFGNQSDLQRFGPTLSVMVGFYPAVQGFRNPPALNNMVPALVDTGASESCIDAEMATQLNLPVVDTRRIAGVAGAFATNVYMAQVYIPVLDSTIYGRFAGVHLKAGGQPHRAIVGRLFLMHHTMIYDGVKGIVILRKD